MTSVYRSDPLPLTGHRRTEEDTYFSSGGRRKRIRRVSSKFQMACIIIEYPAKTSTIYKPHRGKFSIWEVFNAQGPACPPLLTSVGLLLYLLDTYSVVIAWALKYYALCPSSSCKRFDPAPTPQLAVAPSFVIEQESPRVATHSLHKSAPHAPKDQLQRSSLSFSYCSCKSSQWLNAPIRKS